MKHNDSMKKAMNQLSDAGKQAFPLPKTDFTRTVPVNAFDAKMLLADIEILMETCDVVGNKYESDHYRVLLYKASALFGIGIAINQNEDGKV